ncbi:hypothetical protein Cgig2_019031 [Carnegiea gigantea]|uniref:Uncharacterized protein n=1 Tax=Carnegiea gigantea TaxID=171969 RepID=A0A9Q1JPQ0_9CARY|nr:hypothetical protein Cgig2_019031 [Carnegiea gigantea]
MAEELMVEWEKLKLTKEEEEEAEYKVEIPEERKEEIALSLLGKFLTHNALSIKTMKTITQAIWRPLRGMVVKELDKNLNGLAHSNSRTSLLTKRGSGRKPTTSRQYVRQGALPSHTLKVCEVIDPETSASDLQYGAWLRASPMKSRRRNAEMELAEERRLFTAFRTQRTSKGAWKKLGFNEDTEEGSLKRNHTA